MRNPALLKVWPVGLLVLAAAMIGPAAVRAQAWLPEAGQASIYVGYEYSYAHWTYFPVDITGRQAGPYVGEGKRIAKGDHYSQWVTADLYYGIRRGLALTAHVPFAETKYAGLYPSPDAPEESDLLSLHFGTHGVDDGEYHTTFQDLDVGLHQTVLTRPFVATPFVKYVYPLQSYEDNAHASPGKHLRGVGVGAALARTLQPFLPDAYGQVTYTYTATERAADHTMHFNKVDMELGYFVTPRLSIKGAVSWLIMSGGVDWDFGPAHIKYRALHDKLANERLCRAGGGASYALTPHYVLYVYGFATVAAANTNATNNIATGVGWNFAMPWARKAPRGDPEN